MIDPPGDARQGWWIMQQTLPPLANITWEWPGRERTVLPPNEEDPMALSTGRVLKHWHTRCMTQRSGVLGAIEPEAANLLTSPALDPVGLLQGFKFRATRATASAKVATAVK